MLRAEAELTDPQKALNGERGEDGRQQLDPLPSPVAGGSSLRAYEDKVLLSLSCSLFLSALIRLGSLWGK